MNVHAEYDSPHAEYDEKEMKIVNDMIKKNIFKYMCMSMNMEILYE